jgi:signal transduction histidine kinase
VGYEPGFVTLSVTDAGPRRGVAPALTERRSSAASSADGDGDRPGLVPAGTGFGLAGIAERVASCGGSLTVGPTAAAGFAVTARLPVR